jgi:CBS domain-containing protein
MWPLRQLHTVTPDTPVTKVLTAMGREDINQLPVVSHGRFEGIISRGHLVRWLQTRAELNM